MLPLVLTSSGSGEIVMLSIDPGVFAPSTMKRLVAILCYVSSPQNPNSRSSSSNLNDLDFTQEMRKMLRRKFFMNDECLIVLPELFKLI